MKTTQYVYITTPNGADVGVSLHTVGHYSPDGAWHPESDHLEREDAARRVHYLNGGQSKPTPMPGVKFSR